MTVEKCSQVAYSTMIISNLLSLCTFLFVCITALAGHVNANEYSPLLVIFTYLISVNYIHCLLMPIGALPTQLKLRPSHKHWYSGYSTNMAALGFVLHLVCLALLGGKL